MSTSSSTYWIVDSPAKAEAIRRAFPEVPVGVLRNPFLGAAATAERLAAETVASSYESGARIPDRDTRVIALVEPDLFGDLYASWIASSLGIEDCWRAAVRDFSRTGIEDAVLRATRLHHHRLEAAKLQLKFERIANEALEVVGLRNLPCTSALALLGILEPVDDLVDASDPVYELVAQIRDGKDAPIPCRFWGSLTSFTTVDRIPVEVRLESIEDEYFVESPPAPLSFAGLVRLAAHHHGMTPDAVWSQATALYEQGRITYPFVPPGGYAAAAIAAARDQVMRSGFQAAPMEMIRATGDTEVEAIRPVAVSALAQDPNENPVYRLIHGHFLEAIMTGARWRIRKYVFVRRGEIESDVFVAKSAELVNPGFRRLNLAATPLPPAIAGLGGNHLPDLAVGYPAEVVAVQPHPRERTSGSRRWMPAIQRHLDAPFPLLRHRATASGRLSGKGLLRFDSDGGLSRLGLRLLPYVHALECCRADVLHAEDTVISSIARRSGSEFEASSHQARLDDLLASERVRMAQAGKALRNPTHR